MTENYGKMGARDLHLFFLIDASDSMKYGGKIETLNNAVREAIPHIRDVARDAEGTIRVHALTFSTGARWLVNNVDIKHFTWENIQPKGVTDMGRSFELLADQLTTEFENIRGYQPVMILLSDGLPTDDYEKGLEKLMDTTWGKKAIRIAIAIGQEADMDVLQAFIGDTFRGELKPLQAKNASELKQYIRWASTAVSNASINPVKAAVPMPPTVDAAVDMDDLDW
ncbi:VWA domain-containing protein [Fusibacter paucivorans]|uniref:VWA domain-containing protein n=1 Tax=Fusibacter paucivorans TaxID=76009 RepID=A0ABS5PM42_9FIRM|nr:VWA domain-containing protein [Fusibacter paucivorans]MBS7526128.1 VWA domain-containing protein [Fusibacter paucivorans]